MNDGEQPIADRHVLDLLGQVADRYEAFRSNKKLGPEGRKERQRAHGEFVATAELLADAELSRRNGD